MLTVTSTTYSDFEEDFCDEWLSIVNAGQETILSESCRRRVISSNPIVTLQYVLDHPNGPWDWGGHLGFRGDRTGLLANPNMTSEFLLHHIGLHPEWGELGMIMLSRHRCLTQKILNKYPNIGWDLATLVKNPRISHEIIQGLVITHPIRKPLLGMQYIAEWSKNPNLSLRYVAENRGWAWSIYEISRNIRLTPETITTHRWIKWDSNHLSLNPTLTWEIIENNPDIEWNWIYLSHRDIIPLRIIELHPDTIWAPVCPRFKTPLQWEWGDRIEITYEDEELYTTYSSVDGHGVSNHPKITWDFILRNRDKAWSLDALSANPHLTPDFEKMWAFRQDWSVYNWSELSAHPQVTWETVEKYPNLPWDFRGLSVNKNVTAIHRKRYPEIIYGRTGGRKKTYWYGCNPNLTLEELPDLVGKTFNYLRNPLATERIDWIHKRRFQHIAALRISRFARDTLYNPLYARARRYLNRVCGN